MPPLAQVCREQLVADWAVHGAFDYQAEPKPADGFVRDGPGSLGR